MSSPSSSNRSHSDQEVAAIVRNASDHFCDIMKSFKVAQLDTMLAVKGKAGRGTKADKALDVSWCYTPEEIKEYKSQSRLQGMPAILNSQREPGQPAITTFFARQSEDSFGGRV